METKEILKYRREADYWLCPQCETENSMLVGRCSLCGYTRSSGAAILNKWTPEEDKPKDMRTFGTPAGGWAGNAPPAGTEYNGGYASYPPPPKSNDGVKLLIGILVVAFLVIIILAAASSAGYAESVQYVSKFVNTYIGAETPFRLLT